MPTQLTNCAAVLTMEVDMNQFINEPLRPLNRDQANTLAESIASDLNAILGNITHLGMVVPGVLYDQTEVLRPGFPLLTALADIFQGLPGDFSPQLVALGTDGGRFPVAAVNSQSQSRLTPFLVLPFCFVGPEDEIKVFANAMEDNLLQQGAVSAATRDKLEFLFQLKTLNASYGTLNDLCAFLKLQLDNNGFLPLWELLEHAFFWRSGVNQTVLPTGNRYLLADAVVHTPFYTFDAWAQWGPGSHLASSDLGDGYLAWLQTHRQYTMTLDSYGLQVRVVPATPNLPWEDSAAVLTVLQRLDPLDGAVFQEIIEIPPTSQQEKRCLVTEHASPLLGTMVYTVACLDEEGKLLSLAHHYPLQIAGLKQLNDFFHQQQQAGIVLQRLKPGKLIYSESQRCLISATDGDGQIDPGYRWH